ncbi:MAG: AtpZ/AtpI family protein [Patescibacteria group bacterium]|jgi:F0F1-type ATP synthase assembly protein I
MSDRRDKNTDSDWSALRFAWELGYTIAIPVVVLAVGGAFADRWLGTKPWIMIAGIGLSMLISTVGVYMKAIRVMSRMDRTSSQTKPAPDPKNDQIH